MRCGAIHDVELGQTVVPKIRPKPVCVQHKNGTPNHIIYVSLYVSYRRFFTDAIATKDFTYSFIVRWNTLTFTKCFIFYLFFKFSCSSHTFHVIGIIFLGIASRIFRKCTKVPASACRFSAIILRKGHYMPILVSYEMGCVKDALTRFFYWRIFLTSHELFFVHVPYYRMPR